MLHIQRFVVNMIQENTYLLWDDTREAVLIDCGAFYPEEKQAIADFIAGQGLTVRRLLQTHGHFDHIFGADFVKQTYGVGPELSHDEVPTYEQAKEQMRSFLHRDLPLDVPAVAATFAEGDLLAFGDHALRVIATPGHTPGGACFYDEEEGVLLSGDSLFRREIGRCDLPGGNESLLVESLRRKVLALPEDVTVCPGHGDMTTIGEERRGNRHLQ